MTGTEVSGERGNATSCAGDGRRHRRPRHRGRRGLVDGGAAAHGRPADRGGRERPADRRTLHPDRPHRPHGERGRLRRAVHADLLRLHLLPGHLPDRDADLRRGDGPPRPAVGPGAADADHGRPGPRHAGASRGVRVAVPPASRRADGDRGADRPGRPRLSRLLRQGRREGTRHLPDGSLGRRLSHGAGRALRHDLRPRGAGRPDRRADPDPHRRRLIGQRAGTVARISCTSIDRLAGETR